jgi:hypothetical protein
VVVSNLTSHNTSNEPRATNNKKEAALAGRPSEATC